MAKTRSLINTTKLIKHADSAADANRKKGERHIRHPRSSIILSTTHWLARGRYIALWINPLQTQWSLGRRETVTKTAAGAVRNTWRNRFRNTYYDEFTVSFAFQAGNIMPSAGVSPTTYNNFDDLLLAVNYPTVPHGLKDFYDFISMLDQPLLMGQAENRHVIVYRSRLFPRLRMSGYWLGTTPIKFKDDGNKGNVATWNATFQCYNTSPPLWSWRGEKLSGAWAEWARQHGEEILDPALAKALQPKRGKEKQGPQTVEAQARFPPPPTDPRQAPPKSSSKVVVGKRANTGVKRIGLVTGDSSPGGKRVVSPTNTPAQWPFTGPSLEPPS